MTAPDKEDSKQAEELFREEMNKLEKSQTSVKLLKSQ